MFELFQRGRSAIANVEHRTPNPEPNVNTN